MSTLDFKPLRGFSSSHLQTIVSAILPSGPPPPSEEHFIDLEAGDWLSCHVSTPPFWAGDRSVILVHGMGGSHASGYMVRMARKLYQVGVQCVRVNLRGAGTGRGFSKRPYHAGTSEDVSRVVKYVKEKTPDSRIFLTGFSLGGNVVLKLAGEMGEEARSSISAFFAICPPLDLADAVRNIEQKRNRFYHAFYLNRIRKQARPWGDFKNLSPLSAFDDVLTAPLWGFKNRQEYYSLCSSLQFLDKIRQTTHLLFAQDDPIVSWKKIEEAKVPACVHTWIAQRGGHMGFLGASSDLHEFYAMDAILLRWIFSFCETNRQ